MTVIAVNKSQDSPNHRSCDMHWCVKSSDFHINREGNRISKEKLEDMRIHTCKTNSSIILVMDLMIFVQ